MSSWTNLTTTRIGSGRAAGLGRQGSTDPARRQNAPLAYSRPDGILVLLSQVGEHRVYVCIEALSMKPYISTCTKRNWNTGIFSI